MNRHHQSLKFCKKLFPTTPVKHQFFCISNYCYCMYVNLIVVFMFVLIIIYYS
jgi:hypothetical protein